MAREVFRVSGPAQLTTPEQWVLHLADKPVGEG